MGKVLARIDRELTLYVRSLAWLHATPKPDEGTKRAKLGVTGPGISRLDAMKKDKIIPVMPPNPAPHVTDRLIEIGLSEAAGMGTVPLSWREIDAWCSRTRVDLPPWEARLIRKLSSAYLAEGRIAEKESCPPPWRTVVTQQEKDIEEAQLIALLG